MLVIILRYHDPAAPALLASLDAHRAFLNRHFSNGDFVCAGPLPDKAGEVIIARRKVRDEIARIMEREPYVAGGAAGYDLFPFNPATYAEGFERFL